MLIPGGTNVPPYMVARGRQPSLPSGLERFELGDVWCRNSTGWFLPCEFKYQKFWYSVPRMLPLFRSLTLFLASSGSLAALAGPEADLAVWVFLRANQTR